MDAFNIIRGMITILWVGSCFLLFSYIAILVFMWGFFLGNGIQEENHKETIDSMADQYECYYE